MFTARSVLEAATDGQPTLPTPTSCGNTLLVVRLGYDQFERTLLRPLAEKGGEEDHKKHQCRDRHDGVADAAEHLRNLPIGIVKVWHRCFYNAQQMHRIPQELRSACFVEG